MLDSKQKPSTSKVGVPGVGVNQGEGEHFEAGNTSKSDTFFQGPTQGHHVQQRPTSAVQLHQVEAMIIMFWNL